MEKTCHQKHFFGVPQKIKVKVIWNGMSASRPEWWQDFCFWFNYSFNVNVLWL